MHMSIKNIELDKDKFKSNLTKLHYSIDATVFAINQCYIRLHLSI
jgi:hypothetical protein